LCAYHSSTLFIIKIGCRTGEVAEDGWDHTFYQYRQQAVNFDYAKNVNWKFIDAPYIANLCEDEYNVRDVINQSSGRTFLVHSKFPYLHPDEQWLRRTFIAIMGRYSTPSERRLYRSIVTDKLVMKYTTIIDTLCSHYEHHNYLASLPTTVVDIEHDRNGVAIPTSARTRAASVCSDDGRTKLLAQIHPSNKNNNNNSNDQFVNVDATTSSIVA
jgi:hypothetical protein